MADTDVLVITGGAGGMGLACACALAGRGHLLLVDVDKGQCDIRVDGGLVGAAKQMLGGG